MERGESKDYGTLGRRGSAGRVEACCDVDEDWLAESRYTNTPG
jgi:hypothetical protein